MMNIEWKENLTSEEWDTILSSLQGHPLQSAKWGDARKAADGINDIKWAVFQDGQPVFLVRAEERYLFKKIKIAWIPRGPTVANRLHEKQLHEEFLKRLKQNRFFLGIFNSYKKNTQEKQNEKTQHTIWLDVTLGKDALWDNLDTTFRRHVRNAKRKNVIVEQSKDLNDVQAFYNLCKLTSQEKGFDLHTSESSLNKLILEKELSTVTSHLFVARLEGQFCGGLFVMRSGNSIHNWLAAIDRKYAKHSIGELLHWEVVEWAVKQQCERYDLEGIDKKNNRSVYTFKMKMGGDVVAFPGLEFRPLNLVAKLAVVCYSFREFLQQLRLRMKEKKLSLQRQDN
jgi:lipid II:glycine glycyltransferase (peptidoglycan interpeptide bridge formation enzyme)